MIGRVPSLLCMRWATPSAFWRLSRATESRFGSRSPAATGPQLWCMPSTPSASIAVPWPRLGPSTSPTPAPRRVTSAEWRSPRKTPLRQVNTPRASVGTTSTCLAWRTCLRSAIVHAHYESAVTHPNHLWNGRLVRAEGGQAGDLEAILSFARDLPGADRRPGNRDAPMFLGPVPLWDGCPTGGVAVLDAVARTVYFYGWPGSLTPAPESVALPWEPGPLLAEDRLAYIVHQMKAETRGQDVDESEIKARAVQAAREAQDLFPLDAPVAVDLRCGPNRVWLQEYDRGSSPLGYGTLWRAMPLNEPGRPRFMRVAFPPGFAPFRFLDMQALGTVVNSSGLQRLAVAELFQQGE